jgi:pimeloyl-ACP methyl ester carboxylesterase
MRIDVNGIGLNVQDEGAGPPVLLLHGWPDSHRLWRHQVADLTAAGFRTIAPTCGVSATPIVPKASTTTPPC